MTMIGVFVRMVVKEVHAKTQSIRNSFSYVLIQNIIASQRNQSDPAWYHSYMALFPINIIHAHLGIILHLKKIQISMYLTVDSLGVLLRMTLKATL